MRVRVRAEDGGDAEPVPPGPLDAKGPPPPRDTSVSAAERDALLARAQEDPGVRKLLLEFGAQVVEIRPMDPPRDLVPDGEDPGPAEDSR